MSYLKGEENDPSRPQDNDPVRKLWGEFDGPDYDITYESPYEIPPSAYEENVWFDAADTKLDFRSGPPRPTPAKPKPPPKPAGSQAKDTTAIPRRVEVDKSKFISSFKAVALPPAEPPLAPGEVRTPPWLALVKEAAALEKARKQEQQNVPPAEPDVIMDLPFFQTPAAAFEKYPEDYTDEAPPFSWVQTNIPFIKYQPAGTESKARAAELAYVDGLIKRGLQKNVLGKIPKSYFRDKKQNRTLKAGNPRVTNTIHYQAAMRKVLSLIQSINMKDNPPNPPKALPAPEPLKSSEVRMFDKFKEPELPHVNNPGLDYRQRLYDNVVDALLRRSLMLLLAQIGYTEITKKTLQLFLDTTMYYFKNVAKNIGSKKRPDRTTRDMLEASLHDYDTCIEDLREYYLEDVVRREQTVYNKYVRTHNKYWALLKAKRKKNAQRTAEGDVIIQGTQEVIPELHVPDRPEGFEDIPNLAPGMEILQTLEQEEAASLRLQDYMNSPTDGQASGSATIPFPLPVLQVCGSPSTSSDLTTITSVQHLPPGAQQGLEDTLYTEYQRMSFLDYSEVPGGSNLIAGYSTSETVGPVFSVSPSTSGATITSSPATPGPSHSAGPPRKRRR